MQLDHGPDCESFALKMAFAKLTREVEQQGDGASEALLEIKVRRSDITSTCMHARLRHKHVRCHVIATQRLEGPMKRLQQFEAKVQSTLLPQLTRSVPELQAAVEVWGLCTHACHVIT